MESLPPEPLRLSAPTAATNDVVAALAVDGVVAVAAEDRIITIAAVDLVVAGAAGKGVGSECRRSACRCSAPDHGVDVGEG